MPIMLHRPPAYVTEKPAVCDTWHRKPWVGNGCGALSILLLLLIIIITATTVVAVTTIPDEIITITITITIMWAVAILQYSGVTFIL